MILWYKEEWGSRWVASADSMLVSFPSLCLANYQLRMLRPLTAEA